MIVCKKRTVCGYNISHFSLAQAQYETHYSAPQKLLDQVRETLHLKHYSRSTEKTYLSWIKRFILFHNKRHPQEMGESEIKDFLTYLAIKKNVAASTQNQAFHALLFLYRHVLHKKLQESIQAIRAKRPQRLPTVLGREEARQIIEAMEGETRDPDPVMNLYARPQPRRTWPCEALWICKKPRGNP